VRKRTLPLKAGPASFKRLLDSGVTDESLMCGLKGPGQVGILPPYECPQD